MNRDDIRNALKECRETIDLIGTSITNAEGLSEDLKMIGEELRTAHKSLLKALQAVKLRRSQ